MDFVKQLRAEGENVTSQWMLGQMLKCSCLEEDLDYHKRFEENYRVISITY